VWDVLPRSIVTIRGTVFEFRVSDEAVERVLPESFAHIHEFVVRVECRDHDQLPPDFLANLMLPVFACQSYPHLANE
jgi:hypothetical protein